MDNSNNNIETLLKQKIQELGHYLVSICENENKKKDIKDALLDLPFYKILLFISFLDKDKADNQINDFVKLFCLNNNEENRVKILEYLKYFLEIKTILNE